MRGELTLFKRPKSHEWQCSLKLPNGQWHAASTAREDSDLAQTQAIAIYETVKIKISAGLAVTTKTFKQGALDEIVNMAQATDNKTVNLISFWVSGRHRTAIKKHPQNPSKCCRHLVRQVKCCKSL